MPTDSTPKPPVLLVLLTRKAEAAALAADLEERSAAAGADLVAIVPPVRGLAFFADAVRQDEIDAWWAQTLQDDDLPVYVVDHDASLLPWLRGIDGTVAVRGAEDEEGYDELDHVEPLPDLDGTELADALLDVCVARGLIRRRKRRTGAGRGAAAPAPPPAENGLEPATPPWLAEDDGAPAPRSRAKVGRGGWDTPQEAAADDFDWNLPHENADAAPDDDDVAEHVPPARAGADSGHRAVSASTGTGQPLPLDEAPRPPESPATAAAAAAELLSPFELLVRMTEQRLGAGGGAPSATRTPAVAAGVTAGPPAAYAGGGAAATGGPPPMPLGGGFHPPSAPAAGVPADGFPSSRGAKKDYVPLIERVLRMPRPAFLSTKRSAGAEASNEELASIILTRKPIVIVVGSRKGGVGKTSHAAGIAVTAGIIVEHTGQRAAIVDANIANPDAWGQLNLPPGAATVRDCIAALSAGREPPDPVHAATPALACYAETRETTEYSKVEIDRLAVYLEQRFAVIVVDMSNRLPDLTAGPEAAAAAYWLEHADILLLPTMGSKSDFIGALDYLDVPNLPPVVVPYIEPRHRPTRAHPVVREYLDAIRARVHAVVTIPDDDRAGYAILQGVAAADISPPLKKAYRELTETIVRTPPRVRR